MRNFVISLSNIISVGVDRAYGGIHVIAPFFYFPIISFSTFFYSFDITKCVGLSLDVGLGYGNLCFGPKVVGLYLFFSIFFISFIFFLLNHFPFFFVHNQLLLFILF